MEFCFLADADGSFQTLLDRSTPLTVQRWAFTGFLVVIFGLVVIFRQGVSVMMCVRDDKSEIGSLMKGWIPPCFNQWYISEFLQAPN